MVIEMSESVMKEEFKLDSELLAKAVVRLMKRDIFVRYKQTGEITDEDWEFCEKIDWHPVDELPLKEEFVKRLKEARKETPTRFNSVDEFFEAIK